MVFILDTDTCIYFLNGTFRSIAAEISSRPLEEIAVSAISVAELYFGAQHSSRKAANIESLQKFLKLVQVLPFDHSAASEFGQLKETLARSGKMIGPYDLLIAAIARSQKGTLVTHNTKEFSAIKDLLIVDWVR